MWDQEDSFMWFWLNLITTLFIAVLAIEQYTVLVASPFGVLGYVIVGWAILRFFEWLSVDEGDMIRALTERREATQSDRIRKERGKKQKISI